MIARLKKLNIDWSLFAATIPLLVLGLATMNSFGAADNYYFSRQIMWIAVSLAVFFSCGFVDWRFLRKSEVVTLLYGICLAALALLYFVSKVKGAQSWFSFGGFSFQPADFTKLVLILMLAKYFSKRHVEIAHIRHIIVSGVYALIPFLLILIQPDFGSALIIFMIWFGMILVSGVSRKHLLILSILFISSFTFCWLFVFHPYQKERIMTFIHPLADIQGAGYNAFQSKVAVGSGQILGKGVGYGTQSRLSFLPEYETDFIFAAFSEEWGLIGVLIVFLLFGVIIRSILQNAVLGASNFETLFAVGLAIFFMSHIIIHIGMNTGLLPVTGLPLPLLSYGGSHLLAEFLGLGILMGMRRYQLAYHRGDIHNEFVGPQ